ncbi:MAG: P-loop NTPase [Candidatus Binataceae bacterium]|nr:P-loop NTPase [Candidatus Binataceae bacterium]
MRIFREIEALPGADGAYSAPDLAHLRANLSGIKSIVAVSSAKGGTGKSAITINIAAALAIAGRKVGILDADLNSPSVLPMLGMKAPRRIFAFEGAEPGAGPLGLRVASSNLLPDGEPPPMNFLDEEPVAGIVITEEHSARADFPADGEVSVNGEVTEGREVAASREVSANGNGAVELSYSGTLRRLLTETRFGALDMLLIDLAPGLDELYRIARIAPLSGAVIVTHPSDSSVTAARHALEIAAHCATRVIGIVENMVGFSCDGCHTVRPLMPQGDLAAIARIAGSTILGRLPFDPRLAESSDRGVLFVREYAATPLALNLTAIAQSIDQALIAINHAPLASPV